MKTKPIKINIKIFLFIIINLLLISCAELAKFIPIPQPSIPIVYLDIYTILEKNKLESEKLSKDQNIIELKENSHITAKTKIVDVSKKEYGKDINDCKEFLYQYPGKNYRFDIEYGGQIKFTPGGFNRCTIINVQGVEDVYTLPETQFSIRTESIDKDNRFIINYYSRPIVSNPIFDTKKRKEEIKNYYNFFENLKKNQIIFGQGTISHIDDVLK